MRCGDVFLVGLGRAAVLSLLFTSISVVGCDDGDGGKDDVDGGQVVDGMTAATPGVGMAVVDSAHEGWAQADCLGCHDTFHTNNFGVGECSGCHGTNGAPTRGTGHDDSDCRSCHADSHGGEQEGLDSPRACRSCHVYESTDGCAMTEAYDVVVVGAGGGGMAAAAQLAREGLSVAVLEQHFKPGGCMVTFPRGDYRFEASLHAYDGWGMSYLNVLQIRDEVESVSSDVMYRVVYPDFVLDVSSDKDEYAADLKELFPDEADAIDDLFAGFSVTNVASYAGMSAAEAIASHGITDEQLISVLANLTGFLAELPEDLPAESFIPMWDSYHSMGYHYFEGGSQAVTDALENAITENGGVIKTGALVEEIVVEDGAVTGVRTAGGGCFETSYVVSNVSVPVTFRDLVGEEHIPQEMIDELDARSPASSNIAMIYLGVDHDYADLFEGGSHEWFIKEDYGYDSEFAGAVRCNPDLVPFAVANYSMVDPTAAPAGKNAIVITADFMDYDCSSNWNWGDSYESYNAYKESVAETLIARLQEYLPELEDHLEVVEVATPVTVERYTLNPGGSWAGWAFDDVEVVYSEDMETPIDGLFMAGAWVTGGGQSVALSSGISAATAVINAMEE